LVWARAQLFGAQRVPQHRILADVICFERGSMADAVAEKVIATLAAVKRIPADKITLESNLQELGIDSLDVFTLLFELENAFKISIPDDDVRSIRTVKDVVEGIKKLMAAAPSQGSVGSTSPVT
jgi:acyl carrier protein